MQLTTSNHLALTRLSHTSPTHPLNTSQEKASLISTSLFVRILPPDLFTIQLFVCCMLLSIIINQTSSFNALTVVLTDFVATHSFWAPRRLPISHFARFLR